jgi:hypothetical protein
MGNITKKLILISCSVLMTITSFSIVYTQGIINLPQTGQKKYYDLSGTEINCSGTVQVGEIKSGVAWLSPRFSVGRGAEPDGAAKPRLIEAYGKLPLHFEANQGQVEGTVRYLSRGSGYGLFLTSTEAVLTLRRGNQASEKKGGEAINPVRNSSRALNPAGEQRGIISNGENPQTDILPPPWEGRNQNPSTEGVDELEGKSHYFIGNDPDQWRTNIPLYRKVRYRELYPGIDLIYYGNQRQLEYDLVVTPKGDPGAIRLLVEGAEGVRVDEEGNLILRIKGGEVIQHAPQIYQKVEGKKQFIKGGYIVDPSGKNEDTGKVLIGFKIDKFDKKKPLIIDPILVYSTYLGGSGDDGGFGIAVDSSGNAYITGYTLRIPYLPSTNFPTVNPIQGSNAGYYDAFVTKLNPAGSAIVYSTYLGGGLNDDGQGIAVDSSGSAYITGSTYSTNFPTVNPIQGSNAGYYDAFVTKLNPAGSAIVYSTYLGGSDWDEAHGIAVDSSGSAYITGATESTNFPTVNRIQGTNAGYHDVFVTKLNPGGSAIVYSTYLGGSGWDYGYGIAVDSSGNAYITGATESTNFPTVNPIQGSNAGGYDAFVTKLNPAGSAIVYSTYLGGSDWDEAHGIAVDSSGSAYITGASSSTNFPTVNPIQGSNAGGYDAFVTKLNPAGSAIVYSTYLGGSEDDDGYGIAVDSSGSAYITGITYSTNFPTVNPIQGTFAGGLDAFVTKIGLNITETISTPATPTGPTIGTPYNSYSYSTGGSVSSLGHSVQYFFDWGDGTNSGWLPVGTISASHSWNSLGTYTVKAQARCVTDTNVLSPYCYIDVTISAPITYTLTVNINPSGAGTVTLNPPGGTYNAGTAVTLTATANSGYTFSSWSGVDSSSGTTGYVTMNGNRTVTANFSQIRPGDCNGDGQTTIDEVQKAINQYLEVSPAQPCCDLNGNGQVSIDEVQRVINAFLGI